MRAVCVCVPVRDEAERLPTLLKALEDQKLGRRFRVVLCVNNSTDASLSIARSWSTVTIQNLDLDVIDCTFEPFLAHVGSARRAAMERGAELLRDDDAVLISTDADCRPPTDWIAANVNTIENGSDLIVGGEIKIDDLDRRDPVAEMAIAVKARLDRYWAKVRAIEDAIDPTPWDPAPRHGDHTGASLAISVGLYRRAGGVPLRAIGEDRALVDAARAVGGRLVHPRSVWTAVSGRTAGRAPGGMAEGIRRLAEGVSEGRPPRVPDFKHWRARATWRKAMRERHSLADAIGMENALPPMPLDLTLDQP